MPSQEVLDYQQYVKETGQKDPEFEQYLKETGQQVDAPSQHQPLAQFPAMQHGLDTATARIQDTMQMSKPDMQGPPMPLTMPAEVGASQQALGMAAGQMPLPGKAAPVQAGRIDPFTKLRAGESAIPTPKPKSTEPTVMDDLTTLILGRRAPAAKRLARVAKKVAAKTGDKGVKAGLETLLLGGQMREEAIQEE